MSVITYNSLPICSNPNSIHTVCMLVNTYYNAIKYIQYAYNLHTKWMQVYVLLCLHTVYKQLYANKILYTICKQLCAYKVAKTSILHVYRSINILCKQFDNCLCTNCMQILVRVMLHLTKYEANAGKK